MIPKSGHRFSEKIMLHQRARVGWRFEEKSSRSSLGNPETAEHPLFPDVAPWHHFRVGRERRASMRARYSILAMLAGLGGGIVAVTAWSLGVAA
ncbi:MAG: hypothetical protein ABWY92_15240, partial [Xanthobacteraceae bacterium]